LVANQAVSILTGGSRIDGIEVIDLSAAGRNTVKLNLLDVIDMGSANTFETTARQQLMVKGGAGDTVQLMDTNAVGVWTKAANTVTLDGAQYHVLNHNTAAATLYVQDGVAVTDFVAGAPGVQVIDYISIGRLYANKSAFGAWFDTDEDGVYDSAKDQKLVIEHEIAPDWSSYSYKLAGVDFAAGSYTVRFVDLVMSPVFMGDSELVIPNRNGDYGHLKLSDLGFGGDDKVIIDMDKYANEWMGLGDREIFDQFGQPAISHVNGTVGTYADGIYGEPASTGLFGQLEAGTRPSDSRSIQHYARLDIFAPNENSSEIKFEAIKYIPPTTSPYGGDIKIQGVLVDLGVPVTPHNVEFVLPTTFIV
jgi:hypothetical protein